VPLIRLAQRFQSRGTNRLKLWLNSVSLHDLGIITIQGQQSQFTPEDLPQKEIRTLTIKIDFFQDTFSDNYALLTSVRTAVKAQNKTLLWQDEDNEDASPGQVYLNQTVTLVSEDIPADPNAWGTYQQQITLVVRYEVNDLVSSTTHLQATFKKTGRSGAAYTLGNVWTWNEDYKSKYYSELHNLRDRSSGTIAATGEWISLATASPTARRATLQATAAQWNTEINAQDGALTYGSFFSATVRVDAFKAEVNQAVTGIRWSATFSYTRFPNEAGYAASDFKAAVSTDQETGDCILQFSGRVGAPSTTIARAKLDALRTAVLSTAGFAMSNQLKAESEEGYLSVDDNNPSPALDGTGKPYIAYTGSGRTFIELSFGETYRKRAANILSYTLNVTDEDDTATGLIQKTYAGSVVATSTSDSAAYNLAVATARQLGDNKHSFRMTATLTRNDRKPKKDANQEFVKLEFSFRYKTKGERIYLEIRSETSKETFGEDNERVSGVVIAKDLATAQATYASLVKASYTSRLIRSETLGDVKEAIALGTYAAAWTPNGSYEFIPTGFTFSFAVFKPKPDGEYAMKYGESVELEYTGLKKISSLRGGFFASPTILDQADVNSVNYVSNNPLDAFLSALSLGKRLSGNREMDVERVGATGTRIKLAFSVQFVDKLTTDAQIIECKLTDRINHSLTRIAWQEIPDGEDIPQECGTKRGSRSISGSVKAATEAAANTWIATQRSLALPEGQYASTGFEDNSERGGSWEFLPFTDGVARGGGANFLVYEASFSYVLNYAHLPRPS
jgi:hypothetical protein